MKFEFKAAQNGLLMTVTFPDGEIIDYTYTDPVDDWDTPSQEISRFHEFLWLINEHLGPTTDRYSAERIVIRVEEGDKYEKPSNNA